jgi:hypothetical protein
VDETMLHTFFGSDATGDALGTSPGSVTPPSTGPLSQLRALSVSGLGTKSSGLGGLGEAMALDSASGPIPPGAIPAPSTPLLGSGTGGSASSSDAYILFYELAHQEAATAGGIGGGVGLGSGPGQSPAG